MNFMKKIFNQIQKQTIQDNNNNNKAMKVLKIL